MNEKIYYAKSKKKLNEKIQFLSFLGAVLSNPNYKTSTFTSLVVYLALVLVVVKGITGARDQNCCILLYME